LLKRKEAVLCLAGIHDDVNHRTIILWEMTEIRLQRGCVMSNDEGSQLVPHPG
jgi:hypothetical protein